MLRMALQAEWLGVRKKAARFPGRLLKGFVYELVNVGRFLADDWIREEVSAEVHNDATGSDLTTFCSDA